MKFFRSFIVLVEICIFGIGALIIGCIIFPVLSIFIKRKNRRKIFSEIIHLSWNFFIRLMKITKVINIHLNEKLSKIRGKIVVASHPSLIDIVILIGQMPKSLCLAKQELLKNPVMHNIVKSLYIINNIDPEIFQKNAMEALSEGYNIVIFPTGTRTLPNEPIKIHKGAAQLSILSGINITPINIKTDYPFLIKHHSPLDAGEKTVNYHLKIMPEINPKDYLEEPNNEIKARNHICEKIKKYIN